MKLISWNVNGFRSVLGKGFADFFDSADADAVCLQETKMQPGQADFAREGYAAYWSSAEKKGYSGTVLFTRRAPLSVSYGIGESADSAVPGLYSDEGRIITADFGDFYLINSYSPNVQRELTRMDYRMGFEDALRTYMSALDRIKPVVLCGDLNVAHEEIDIKNAKSNIGNAGFTYEERGKMTELLSAGFADSFRRLYPDRKDAYTWWSYMFKARERNTGWRIDYFIVSERLMDRVEDALIFPEVTGSDHCPVGLVLKDQT